MATTKSNAAAPTASRELLEPSNVIDAHLAQAKAICDLIASTIDVESLHDDTIGWAMVSAIEHIDAAREVAGKLNQAPIARHEPQP